MCGIGSRLAAGAGSGVRCAVSRRRSGGFLDREVEDFIAVEVAPVAECKLPDVLPVGFREAAVPGHALLHVPADAVGVLGFEPQADGFALEAETGLGPDGELLRYADQAVAEGGAGAHLQPVVHAAHGRLVARVGGYLDVIHPDVEVFAGANPHLDPHGGVNPQVAVQLVGKHARTPFDRPVACDGLVDDRSCLLYTSPSPRDRG